MNLRKLSECALLTLACIVASVMVQARAQAGNELWAHGNLFAWGVAPFDAKHRDPEEQARMLDRLGFRSIAYNWRNKNIPEFDTEIATLQKHHIRLIAWALYVSDDPAVTIDWKKYNIDEFFESEGLARAKQHLSLVGLLETFRRHGVTPELWLIDLPKSQLRDFPKTPAMQKRRIRQEAARIAALVKLAESYGVQVELYNHNGWIGMVQNELDIITRLQELGVHDVNMVYNFDHARDKMHDDTRSFPAVWAKIKTHVVAVNVSGTAEDPLHLYPSQGDRELEMMRVIQQSGWRGPVGLNTETGGDAEVTLRNCLRGLDWLAAELRQSGSGGPPPFPIKPH